MKKLKLLFIGLILGIIISVFTEEMTYEPVVEHYHIDFVKDWEKTATPRERDYYQHLINTKP